TRSRLVPIGRLFGRYARQVRELARAAGKTVDLELAGEGVELDNTVIEQIADPLLHLVQNAVFHGVEPAAERLRRGKPEHGTVSLRAYHEGGAVYVEVEDDGRGLDADRLRASAVRGGFLDAVAAAGLSEREALDLVFLPGFSTAEGGAPQGGRGPAWTSARPPTSFSCRVSAPRRWRRPRRDAAWAWTSSEPISSGSAARSTSRPRWESVPASLSSCPPPSP